MLATWLQQHLEMFTVYTSQETLYCSQHHFREAIPDGAKLRYAGRPASASPAVGYISLHLKQQKALVEEALN